MSYCKQFINSFITDNLSTKLRDNQLALYSHTDFCIETYHNKSYNKTKRINPHLTSNKAICPKFDIKITYIIKTGVAVFILSAILIFILFCFNMSAGIASYNLLRDGNDINQSVNDMLDGLDLSNLQNILNSLTQGQANLLGTGSFLDKIKAVIGGDINVDFGSFMNFIFYVLGLGVSGFLPIIVTIIAISICHNILSSIKGKFSSESTEKVIYFVCVSAVVILLLTGIMSLIGQTADTVNSIKNQAIAVFPILLTLMAGIGASSTAAVYQPSVAVFTTVLIDSIAVVALPIFMASFVFSVVGNLSEGVKLKKMSEFFNSGAKWLLGTMFFVFLAFLSLQGITASVFDGISVRTAKFAISKYVPIIGGYLSEGFNLVMAGGVLVKNAIGLSAILLLVATVLPLIVNLVAFSLLLKLAAAAIEPMGDEKMPRILSQVSKHCSTLAVIIIAMSFLYFVFLLLVIATGNLMI